ncbi:MAG: histidine kinase [Treponema sp.]|nr:histidine kinase [Treponema sp.]
MKSWRSQLNRLKEKKSHTIASRHLGVFLLFVILPVWLTLILFTLFFRYQIVETAKNERILALKQYASGVNVDLQNMSIITSALIHNTALMDRSKAFIGAQTAEQRYLAFSDIDRIFQTHSILSRQLVGFYMVLKGGDVPYISRNFAGINLSNDKLQAYSAMAEVKKGIITIPDSLDLSYGQQAGWYIASLAVSPMGEFYSTGVRSLVVSFVLNPLVNFIRQDNSGDRSNYFLVGRNGLVLASNDAAAAGSTISQLKQNYKKSWIIIESPVELSGWTLAEAVNIHTLTQPFNIILYVLYAALLVILLFFVRYNAFFFARILNPLKLLISKMEAVGNGDFSVRAENGNFFELNRISESFNYMAEKMGLLTETIKKEHDERIRIEMEALRYQINPHFLCNSLNAIRMMALITKNDAITKMSQALMMITEDTLAREDTVYPLEHELYILENYVYIMKVRYGDSFELLRDVDGSLLKLGIPSMILQPLAENAILHGFNGLSRPGIIVVSAALAENDSMLVISVKDNGNGMPEETLNDIFRDEAENRKGLSRIGLSNVRRRIVLAYGGNYGVEVASYPGEGTVVTLKLPLLRTADHESRFKRESS